MEIEKLKEELASLASDKDRIKRVTEIAMSTEHVWIFVKFHYDWRQYGCLKCGAMRVIMPTGETVYKKRGILAFNPFSKPRDKIGNCKLDPKSDFGRQNNI
jgi:hypothetical protein